MSYQTLQVYHNGKVVRLRVTKLSFRTYKFEVPADLLDVTDKLPQSLKDKLIRKFETGSTKRNNS
jgi:hypothetical protein